MRNWFGKSDRDDAGLGRELRALRPEARPEFVDTVAGSLHGRAGSSRMGKVGVAVAVSGLILVAVASFGGVGYASSTSSQTPKKASRATAPKGSTSAAQAQYGSFKPPAKPGGNGNNGNGGNNGSGGNQGTSGGNGTSGSGSGLPFTGLALWIPVALGLALFLTGIVLRRFGRRREAH